MENIQIFKHEQFGEIRTIIDENGNPLFCLPDLCNAVTLTNPSSVKSRLDNEDVQLIDLHALNSNEGLNFSELGNAKTNFVTEGGFYDVLLQSNSPRVKPFRKWVTSEVLPSIRKHGAYLTPQRIEDILSNPDTIIQLATTLKEERLKNAELKAINDELKPKALFADAVATSDRSCLIGELAKILKQNGVEIGQNRLFTWLRNNGYLCRSGESYNQPTQKAMDLSLFEIKKTTVVKPDGVVLLTTTTKVTGKGQIYFVEKFIKC